LRRRRRCVRRESEKDVKEEDEEDIEKEEEEKGESTFILLSDGLYVK
jgi:hypothetical protein